MITEDVPMVIMSLTKMIIIKANDVYNYCDLWRMLVANVWIG